MVTPQPTEVQSTEVHSTGDQSTEKSLFDRKKEKSVARHISAIRVHLCQSGPSAANSYYNPLAVHAHPPIPASGVLHVIKNKKIKNIN